METNEPDCKRVEEDKARLIVKVRSVCPACSSKQTIQRKVTPRAETVSQILVLSPQEHETHPENDQERKHHVGDKKMGVLLGEFLSTSFETEQEIRHYGSGRDGKQDNDHTPFRRHSALFLGTRPSDTQISWRSGGSSFSCLSGQACIYSGANAPRHVWRRGRRPSPC